MKFPTIKIEDVEIPKLMIGINSVLGWSHTSSGRDEWIRKYFTVDRIAEVFTTAVEMGVTGVLGPIYPKLHDAIRKTEDITGQKITFVSTTFGSVEDTARQAKVLKDFGSPICCLHGGWTDRWQVEGGKLPGLDECLKIIRDAGLIPGAASHNCEKLKLMDEGDYDISVFVTPVNKSGFYMSPTQDFALDVVSNCSKPVIAIKPLASGRFDENGIKEWLKWTLDVEGVSAMVIGFMSSEEAKEDIEAVKEILDVKRDA